MTTNRNKSERNFERDLKTKKKETLTVSTLSKLAKDHKIAKTLRTIQAQQEIQNLCDAIHEAYSVGDGYRVGLADNEDTIGVVVHITYIHMRIHI